MKRFLFLTICLAVCLLLIAPGVSCAAAVGKNVSDIPKVNLSADVLKEASKIPDQPHFLLGISSPESKWDKWQEMRKMYRTAGILYQPAGGSIIDKSAADYRADTMLRETVTIFGRKIKIIYLGYHQTPEGQYIMYLKGGEKNLAEFSPLYEKHKARWASGNFSEDQWKDIRKVMGWAQFETVKKYIHRVMIGSAEKRAEYYKNFGFTKKVIEAQEVILDDPDYGKKLDDPVPGLNGLRNRDVLAVPQVEAADFLPDIFMVGLGWFDGGASYWHVEGSEHIVYVSIQALIWEYITGSGGYYHVTEHEFTHNNNSLQNFILGLYVDLEVWAEMATGFLVADPLDFLTHPYYPDWRDLAKNYYGYDTEEVIHRLFPMHLGTVGVLDVSRKEFEENAKQVQQIADELKKFIEKLQIRFYSDPIFWSAVNTKFCDTAAVLRINFALEYQSAGLFDPSKKDKNGKVISPAAQTKEWLTKEEEQIKELAKEAWKNTGAKTKFAEKLEKEEDSKFLAGAMKCPVDGRFFLMNQKERGEVVALVNNLLSQAKAGDWAARMILERAFGGEVMK